MNNYNDAFESLAAWLFFVIGMICLVRFVFWFPHRKKVGYWTYFRFLTAFSPILVSLVPGLALSPEKVVEVSRKLL